MATSWDDELLHGVLALNVTSGVQARIAEVYGSHRATITGGGRPSYRLPAVSDATFRRHVALAHQLGLHFNYVLNAPTLDGREEDPEWQGQFTGFLEYLSEVGVDRITIANETVLRIVGEEFPHFRRHMSLIAGIDTVEAARRCEDLGVDLIVLSPFTVNRDFATLRAIRAGVDCELELYANIPCMSHCPMRDAHYRFSARGSRVGEWSDCTSDPFLLRCSHAYLSDPENLLRSPFIRPEDVEIYREIGIDVIKLSDRSESTSFLLDTARSYLQERYEGNLFDLIFRSGRKFYAGFGGQCAELDGLTLPVQIANPVLDRLRFLERIAELREPELTLFYRQATQEAVTMPDEETLAKWRQLLSNRSLHLPA